MKKETIACFDFDGTITRSDSLLPFLIFSSGIAKTIGYLLLELPALMGYAFKMYDRQQVKEAVLRRFFRGIPEEKMLGMCRDYAHNELPKQVKKEALEAISKHKARGDRLILISASIDAYLKPWADAAGFDCLLSSRLEFKEGAVTGNLVGKNCRAEEKVARLKNLLGDLERFEIYAYGDSRGDKELLESADHPYYRTFQ
ncbi:HAD family hydrolase [Estrella lausannensis]|uniref:HAD-superfamily hydrolase n=1 Tax=Estrella lausannensis TaxID=483423 RepID=A0A0H5DSJ6_9BACT|nr:HAD family hydrolase [Estrella lausannensis]CRX38754.1 HAD-superfamily hydrolase [Estrella lausannensis]